MAETTDDVRTLGPEIARWVKLARAAAKALAVLTPALVGAVIAIRAGAGGAQEVEDKSKSGYKVTREAIEADRTHVADLEHRLAAAELALHRLEVAQPRPRGTPRRPIASPPPASPPPPPRQLPLDLDQAKRQVDRGAPPAPAPAPRLDAAP